MENEIDSILHGMREGYTLEYYYNESKISLFVWEAIGRLLERNKELPEWILAYLKKASKNLMKLAERKGSWKPGELHSDVYKALGMSKGQDRNAVTRYQDFIRDEDIVNTIADKFVDHSFQEDDRYVMRVLKEVAAEKNMTYSNVRKIFERVGAKRGIW